MKMRFVRPVQSWFFLILLVGFISGISPASGTDEPSARPSSSNEITVLDESLIVARDSRRSTIDTRKAATKVDCGLMPHLTKSANNGDAKAQYELGLVFETGTCGKTDLQQAVAWLQKSSKQSYSPAKVALGHLYKDGRGVAKDEVMAMSLYTVAATAKFVGSYVPMGRVFLEGTAAPVSHELAFKWFSKGAVEREAASQYWAGYMLVKGWGVKRDPGMALTLFKESAKQNYEPAEIYISGYEKYLKEEMDKDRKK